MKILYDVNNFIWSAVTNQNNMDVPEGYFTADVNTSEQIGLLNKVLEPGYGYPLLKYIDGVIVPITDYNDYAVSMTILRSYMDKRKKDFSEMIEKSTLDSLRTLFHSLNSDEQLEFRKCFSEYWATGASTQTDVNLSFEGMFRILIKTFYIKDILQRELTVAEKDEYDSLLTLFFNHDQLMEPYLPNKEWVLPLVGRVMDEINTVRFNQVFPKLDYITTPEGE